MIAEVAVSGFTVKPSTYTYNVPPNLNLEVGQAVQVPFGKNSRQGVVVKTSDSQSDFKLKDIEKTISIGPLLTPHQLKFAEEIAESYFLSLAEAIHLFLPDLPKRPIEIDQSIKKPVKQELLLFPTLRQAALANETKQGLLYSHNSPTETLRQWQEVASGQASCLVGSRGALFAPFANLRQITIFQTESDLYKEERRPYYRTFQLAQKLAKIHQAKLVAVSFSPRVADQYQLTHQIKKLPYLPGSKIINLKQQPIINDQLIETISSASDKKVLLFLNRKSERGPLTCRTCKVVSYTDDPAVCPNCGSADVKFKMFNLATLEKSISSKVKGNFTFATQQIFYQDSPAFDRVVLLSADTYLSQSNFLAGEKTFQLITQLMRLVAPSGKIIVQTAHPDSPAVKEALRNDYLSFYQQEVSYRQQTGYPPFTNLAKLTYAVKKPIPTLELENLEIFGPFDGTPYPYYIVRGVNLSPLAELGRPWKLDIDPLNL